MLRTPALRLFLFVLLAGAGCAPPAGVQTLEPGFDGTRVSRLRGNVLPTPRGAAGALELNAERVERPERPPEFALLVEVHARAVRVRPGESLLLVLDGDSVRLARDPRAAPWWHPAPDPPEQARYPCDAALLRRLAGAAEVRLAVAGAAWSERRTLAPENLATLRSFVRDHLDAAGP